MADTDIFLAQDGSTTYHQPLFDAGNGLYSLHRVDKSTWATIIQDYEHHEIHSGSHYYIAGYTTLDSASSDLIDFAVVTPNTTTWANMTFNISSVGQVAFTIYEGVTFDSDGTAVTAFNNNRNSANTSALEITTNPSNFTPADSDRIFYHLLGKDGTVIEVTGGTLGRSSEIILKQNTKYIFRLDSGTAGNVINYIAEWYEHADKAS